MKDQFYSNHGDLTLAQKQQIVDYLIADRMSNYGYDWKTFNLKIPLDEDVSSVLF